VLLLYFRNARFNGSISSVPKHWALENLVLFDTPRAACTLSGPAAKFGGEILCPCKRLPFDQLADIAVIIDSEYWYIEWQGASKDSMKLLLIEDDRVIAEHILKGLRENGFNADHAADGPGGLDLVLNESYDLAIIDIMLPHLSGLDIVERARIAAIDIPIIILSARRSVDDRIAGLRHGSDDYLTKPFSFSELLARIEALLRRASHVTDPTTLTVNDLTLDLLARTVQRNNRKINLQPREFNLLEYLMRNKGHVVSKTMIMERVWNYNFDTNTNIVEARISRLRDKIDRGFDKPLIHTVRGMGYVFKP